MKYRRLKIPAVDLDVVQVWEWDKGWRTLAGWPAWQLGRSVGQPVYTASTEDRSYLSWLY